LKQLFIEEAKKYQVFPLDASVAARIVAPRPNITAGRTEFVYTGPWSACPRATRRCCSTPPTPSPPTSTCPKGGAEGMILTSGGRFAGYGFYLLKGKPVFLWNMIDLERIKWEGPEALSPGKHTVEFDFKYDGLGAGTLALQQHERPRPPGTGTLKVDGKVVDTKKMKKTLPMILQWDESFDIGSDTLTGVNDADYKPPFPLTAKLDKLTIKVDRPQLSPADIKNALPGTYVVQFGKQLVGFLTPANRQDAGSWIEEVYSESGRVPLSPYLADGIGFADKLGTPVIVAVDLKHVFSTAFIRDRLDSVQSLAGQNVDLDQLSTSLAGVQGMMLGLTITDQVNGMVKVDFDQEVTLTAAQAKPLLLEALANHGATIDEFQQWECVVRGKEITLAGALQQSGMRRVFSLLDAPPALQNPPPTSSAAVQETDQKFLALASLQYFKSITSLLSDLTERRQSGESVTWGEVGLWFQKYAARIDQLPILRVDTDLVDWGSNVSAQLRQAETAMKGIGESNAYRLTNAPNIQAYSTRTETAAGAGVGRYGGYRAGSAYAYQSAYNPDELMLDGNSRQNLATFCQTWVEPEVHDLMDICVRQEHDRQGRVPADRRDRGALRAHAGRSVELARRGQHRWAAPRPVPARPRCSAGMAMKWRWREKMKAAGKPTDKPNMITGPVQICWHKFARYWDVELREIPMEHGR
jgi:copper chaperone CopZ